MDRALGRVIEVTQRQYDTVQHLLYDGADSATIGRRMGVKPGTVRDHIKAVLRAAGLPTRVALMAELMSGRGRLKVVDRSEPLK